MSEETTPTTAETEPTTVEERAFYLKRLDVIRAMMDSQFSDEPPPSNEDWKKYVGDYANESALLFERRLIADVARLEQKCEALEDSLLSSVDGVWTDYEAEKFDNGVLRWRVAVLETELAAAREALKGRSLMVHVYIGKTHRGRWDGCDKEPCVSDRAALAPQEPGAMGQEAPLSQDDFDKQEERARHGR